MAARTTRWPSRSSLRCWTHSSGVCRTSTERRCQPVGAAATTASYSAQVFCTTIFGNLADMSAAFSATLMATLRAIAL
ncbi:MAG: hypothetical protein EBS91_09200 [Betaproteobacteria bacterium]|nr:hypothetical protein [Betaproteobacteria bacterium]